MELVKEYGSIIALCVPLLFYILAVTFRLLDNSASVFLTNAILVTSSYVAAKVIKEQLESENTPENVRKELKKALIFKKLHNICMLLMAISIPLGVLYLLFF